MTETTANLTGRKVVVLIASFARGGSERQAYLLGREMRRRGLDAEVWSLFSAEWDKTGYAMEFAAAGIPVRSLEFGLPRYGWVQRCIPIIRALRNSRVDILLPFTMWPNVVAGLTYRLAAVRVCFWGERSAGSEPLPPLGWIAATQYRKFIANSTAGFEYLTQRLNVPPARISLIPNGVEIPTEHSGLNWRSRLGLHAGQLLVVKVANLTVYKDHATLLRAWKLLQDAWPNSNNRPVLALAGYHSATYEECQRFVCSAGLSSTVSFLGVVPETAPLLQSCDLAVFSSRTEGMPNAVLECMAAGKAVVASDLLGVRDVLGPAADHVLAQPGCAEDFAEKMLNLLQSEEQRHAVAEANLTRVSAEFSVEKMANRYVDIIGRARARRHCDTAAMAPPMSPGAAARLH